MRKRTSKAKTLSELKDQYIGKKGSPDRNAYEYELNMELLGKMIKAVRVERNLTQEQLGQLLGVQRAQISKLESCANSATIDTIIKVFQALKAEINFHVRVGDQYLEI